MDESWKDRVDRLDGSLFNYVRAGGTTSGDLRSLLALHAALAARGDFDYLEIGSYLGRSLQALIADPRCRQIISIDRRDTISPDVRRQAPEYPGNSTANMRNQLAGVPGAELRKLVTIDASTEDLDPADFGADLCFIDAEHTDAAALRDARFCRAAIRDRGVIVFHDRLLISQGIQAFLGEVGHARSYPLAHDLLVVELGMPSVLSDRRVRAQVPRLTWLILARLGATRAALPLSSMAETVRDLPRRAALSVSAPRRHSRSALASKSPRGRMFEIHTFVDDALYEQMRRSFVDAGFSPDAFVRLTDSRDDPYRAITRIGRESTARYPILCAQAVLADHGAGREELLAAVQWLDAVDPSWVVAGDAGVTRDGVVVGSAGDRPNRCTSGHHLVMTLEDSFLVFNGRHLPRCSDALSGRYLFGSDVCLNARSDGGSAYVIEFPLARPGTSGEDRGAYASARDRFVKVWSEQLAFAYVLTPSDALFISRFRTLRRLFGSSRALKAIARRRDECRGMTRRRCSPPPSSQGA